MEIDIERIRELVALVKDAQITELTVANSTGRITVKKNLSSAVTMMTPPGSAESSAAATILSQAPATERGEHAASQPSAPALRFVPIKSPVVGTVYLGERPDSEPLVRAGQKVREGQQVCVVEAMKILNDVTAPADGIIAQIVAENGQPVEFGQELMILELENV